MFPKWKHPARLGRMDALLPNISLSELEIFLRVTRLKSVREASRQLHMTPGAVSKILKRLEGKLGTNLMRRSASGILLTADGSELVQLAETMVRMSSQLNLNRNAHQSFKEKVWSLGSISFLSSRLLANSLDRLSQLRPGNRFRVVEFTHNQLVSHGLNGAFEAAVHIGPLDWTRSWSSREIGYVSWGLYCARAHPLTLISQLKESDVLKYPFTVPTGWTQNGFVRGEDHCPIPWGMRHPGHEATTAETSLEMVKNSHQLTFVPTLLANAWTESGVVKKLEVPSWPSVEKKIFLSIRDDLISRPFLLALTQVLSERLSEARDGR